MKAKIYIDTQSDALAIVNIASKYPDNEITIEDENGFRVNAKSMLGVLYSMGFNNLWLVSDIDIYSEIERFII